MALHGGPLNPLASELAELVADALAAAEDARRRGFLTAPGELPLPEGPGPSDAVAPGAAASGWSALAVEARAADRNGARELQRVREELGDCRRCSLCQGRRTLVFGVGNPEADLVVMGEAPGDLEDRQGEPFVGPSGQMLDKMLQHVLGLERSESYLLNLVKCRPPKNRHPLPDEVEACRPFLEAQLQAIRPKLVLVLGAVAYQALFRTDTAISGVRGRWQDYQGIPVMPTFHPAYLLRNPAEKRHTFADLKMVRQRYDELSRS